MAGSRDAGGEVAGWLVEQHTETAAGETPPRGLSYVASGRAEPDTTVIPTGGEPGAAFAVSPWERKDVD